MVLRRALRYIYALLTVTLVLTCVPVLGAVDSNQFKKSFAIFVATYNFETQEARGGVAGTAFFTSSQDATTAYHVLQASSFKTSSLAEKVFVWMIHEDGLAIELFPENLKFFADKDMTRIHLPAHKKVPSRFVFSKVSPFPLQNSQVATEGFIANSVGPKLKLQNGRLVIESIPHLARLQFEGQLLREARVELQARDVALSDIPCLQLSYGPVVGLSGGPVTIGDQVVGMNSFADPTTGAQTWAVDLRQL